MAVRTTEDAHINAHSLTPMHASMLLKEKRGQAEKINLRIDSSCYFNILSIFLFAYSSLASERVYVEGRIAW